jgi:hypothetical protein
MDLFPVPLRVEVLEFGIFPGTHSPRNPGLERAQPIIRDTPYASWEGSESCG